MANICGQKVGRSLGEERLAEFARFFQINPNPVMRLGLEGKVMLANDASREAFGPEVQEGERLTHKHPLWSALTEAMQGQSIARLQLDMDGRAHQVTLRGTTSVYHVRVDVTDAGCGRPPRQATSPVFVGDDRNSTPSTPLG